MFHFPMFFHCFVEGVFCFHGFGPGVLVCFSHGFNNFKKLRKSFMVGLQGSEWFIVTKIYNDSKALWSVNGAKSGC